MMPLSQQLRHLDQAWEALNVLPTTAVDEGFAKTTIELACVAGGGRFIAADTARGCKKTAAASDGGLPGAWLQR